MSCKIEKHRSVFKLFAKYGLERLNYSTSYYAGIRRLWNYIFFGNYSELMVIHL